MDSHTKSQQAAAAVMATDEGINGARASGQVFTQLLSNRYSRQTPFGRRFARARAPVTVFVVVLLVGVYGYQFWSAATDETRMLVQVGALQRDYVLRGEWWRLASATVLHAGALHLLSNLFLVVLVGRFLERLLGSSRYALLYCLSALGGSLASAIAPGAPSVGASGAGFGLLSALLVITQFAPALLPQDSRRSTRSTALVLFAFNAAASLLPGIDLWGHFGGAVTGAVLVASGVLLRGVPKAELEPLRRGNSFRIAALLLFASYTASAVFGVLVGRPWLLTREPEFVSVSLGEYVVQLPSFLPSPRHLPMSESATRGYEFGERYAPYRLRLVVRSPRSSLTGGDQQATWRERHAAFERQLPKVLSPHDRALGLTLEHSVRRPSHYITCGRVEDERTKVSLQGCLLSKPGVEVLLRGRYLAQLNPGGFHDLAYEIAQRW